MKTAALRKVMDILRDDVDVAQCKTKDVDSTALFDATRASTTVFLDTLHHGAYGIALSFKPLPSLYYYHWHSANT